VPEFFDLDGADDVALKAAEAAISAGEVVVFPTDTVYGLAARPDIPTATDRLFEVKQRPRDLTLPVLAASVEAAGTVADLDGRAMALARRFWPGGLTMVLPRGARATAWDLGEERETVGVRIPDHEIALALLTRTGPLAVTSANRSGQPTPTTCADVRGSLGDMVAVYICAGAAAGDVPSTVVDLTGKGVRILRTGAISPDEVLGAIPRSV
jgi:L-threonylcarbamoyladenylate synthase